VIGSGEPIFGAARGAGLIVTGDKDLLDHAGLQPPAIDPRSACEQLGLIQPI
jgi:hypothetical protein